MFHSFRCKECGSCIKYQRLTFYPGLYFSPQVFGMLRVASKMQNNLIVRMDMLGNRWIGVGNAVYPAILNIIVSLSHLSGTHKSHSRTLAVLNTTGTLINRLPHHILFIIYILGLLR